MNVLLVDPFLGGSHKQWAEGWKKHSRHTLTIVGLPGRNWKWRLMGSAPVLVQKMQSAPTPDVIIYTSMANVAVIRGLLPQKWQSIPSALYMHENQLVYPQYIDSGKRPKSVPELEIIQILSTLAVDRVWFNSYFHKRSFLSAIPDFLHRFPDYRWLDRVESIEQKSEVLYVGIEAPEPKSPEVSFEKDKPPIILWNHRWDFDKDPIAFFKMLFRLSDRSIPFRLIAVGANSGNYDSSFIEQAEKRIRSHIMHWGYLQDKSEYNKLLGQADVLPVTSRQDFFGISTVEAIARNTFPLLPDRLAFPEHIPEQLKGQHLYKGMRELEEKLSHYLQAPRSVSQELRSHISKYYWTNIIEEYDEKVELLAQL